MAGTPERFHWRDITPEQVYFSRRRVLGSVGAALGGAALGACRAGGATPPAAPPATVGPVPVRTLVGPLPPPAAATPTPDARRATGDEYGDPLTSYDAITHYNNFYEFSTNKEAVARLAAGFTMDPWTLVVDGLVERPRTFDVDELSRRFGLEERIYRLRCVEGWSIVVPWVGFPLSKLLQAVSPTSAAAYVRFTSVLRPDEMPGQGDLGFTWPYTEGLRIDEAMHDLALLVTGVYGRALPPQNGGPVRLVVPWKYGFKSIKSIQRIELVPEKPTTLWNTMAPEEYGFFANVNPEVDHPRWSQRTERRLEASLARRRTRMFNGYERSIGDLYADLDLRAYY